MIKLLIYLAIGYFLTSLIKAVIYLPKQDGSKIKSTGEDMVEDPCCGTFIPKSQALEKKAGGKKLYFCSRECWQKYKSEGKKG